MSLNRNISGKPWSGCLAVLGDVTVIETAPNTSFEIQDPILSYTNTGK